MEDKKHAFSEADIYQAMVDKMMPEKRHEREAEARALAMSQGPDFLTPDWPGIKLDSVMTVREAVALSCGINRRCAWVIEHHVGEGAARAAIDSARKRLRYVLAECGVTPATDIALKRMVDWTGSTGWSLPIGFPGVKAVLTESSGPPVVCVTARVGPLAASGGGVKPNETVSERNHRHLELFDEEVEKRVKLGALQRVSISEGFERSLMGKGIRKARKERDEQKRTGAWTAQLVQGGKRRV